MPYENGVNWQPLDPEHRGRHATFGSALDAALKDMLVDRNPFFSTVAESWKALFPDVPARPGRLDGDTLWLYVRSPAAMFSVRPRLSRMKTALAALPGAPARLQVRLRIQTEGVAPMGGML